nr:NUMOD4 domain-containing protein [uncultured Flavobacterium sp.]
MEEEWKEIIGFENQYLISNTGSVKSLGNNASRKTKTLKGGITKGGYLFFNLVRDKKSKKIYAHRLVAVHFLENPKNLPQVNHIDNNPLNNKIGNLQWVTSKQNIEHGFKKGRINRKHCSKKCEQYERGILIGIFNSIYEASVITGISRKKISNNCNGLIEYAKGYVFKFA